MRLNKVVLTYSLSVSTASKHSRQVDETEQLSFRWKRVVENRLMEVKLPWIFFFFNKLP